MNDYFIFGTLNQVCINEKCDSMYGWYGFNAQITWKIIYFGWFFNIISRTFGAQIWPHILSKHHINDYLIFGTLHSIVYVPMINLIPCMGDMALMPKLCEKYAIFGDFWWFLGPLEPRKDLYLIPDALWMIALSLGHSIMYVPMRNLIQCMDDMVIVPKICENNQFFVIFDDLWDLWSPYMTPYSILAPYKWLFYLLDTQIVYVPMRNLIQCMGDMALMPKICENNHFLVI